MNYETAVSAESEGSLGIEGEAAPRKGRKLLIGLAILLALVVAAGVAFQLLSGGTAAPADDDDSQAPVVSVISPGAATIEGSISATGSLAARREMPVGVAGEGGRVVSVPVDAGDWVHAGQVLAVIDRSVQNQQISSSAAQVDVAKADAQLAQANLDRALQLVERGFISKADVDRLTATRDAAVARVRVAQAQVGELRARNARLSVVAPASGLVLERNVEPGQVVSAGSGALFLIAKGGEMELMAQLSEDDLAKVSTGVEAAIVPAGTDKQFTGQIWQIAPTINAQNRQGIARIALPYAPELRPGGFATATIKSGSMVAPMLPESAILSDDKGSYVYVIGKDNKALRRSVVLGTVTDDGIAIVKGLSGKEQIVLRAGGFLTEGETVVPRKQAE
ncbi:MAG: efflux RND transporter periplasmic adaptor subunit [Sphingomonadaceae bacterium]|nr:efflux RND transporter periplasmic adaptor subunit [Sphingomonadaceae bacterium]MCP5390604.1 efflux RND transporter periplasmic adaptor subunit [Sphingomonadaceae bacterium]MCP5392799.1 efflux RND transporter periplasmic adaptor subunit [Sphingomonadaceae bacterium]